MICKPISCRVVLYALGQSYNCQPRSPGSFRLTLPVLNHNKQNKTRKHETFAYISAHTVIWGRCCQKQVSQAGISNYIPQQTVGCKYLSLPEMPDSGNKVLIWLCSLKWTFCFVIHLSIILWYKKFAFEAYPKKSNPLFDGYTAATDLIELHRSKVYFDSTPIRHACLWRARYVSSKTARWSPFLMMCPMHDYVGRTVLLLE